MKGAGTHVAEFSLDGPEFIDWVVASTSLTLFSLWKLENGIPTFDKWHLTRVSTKIKIVKYKELYRTRVLNSTGFEMLVLPRYQSLVGEYSSSSRTNLGTFT